MTEHTPGPWVIARGKNVLIGPCPGRAVVKTINYLGAEDTANARLIAAAPDTAAERDRLKAINQELVEALVDAEYAIRHAAGETKHPTCEGTAETDYQSFQVWAGYFLESARAALARAKT